MKKGFHCFNNRGLKATEFNPFKLQMGKLRFREGKGPASGHIASQWLSRDSNPGLLVPRAEFFSRAFLGWFSGAATLKAPGGREVCQALGKTPSHTAPSSRDPARGCPTAMVPRYVTKGFCRWGVAVWEVMRGSSERTQVRPSPPSQPHLLLSSCNGKMDGGGRAWTAHSGMMDLGFD